MKRMLRLLIIMTVLVISSLATTGTVTEDVLVFALSEANPRFEIVTNDGLLDLDVCDVTLGVLLLELSRQTGVTISFPQEVAEHQISLQRRALSLEAMLREILRATGLDKHAWVYRRRSSSDHDGGILDRLFILLSAQQSPSGTAATDTGTVVLAATGPHQVVADAKTTRRETLAALGRLLDKYATSWRAELSDGFIKRLLSFGQMPVTAPSDFAADFLVSVPDLLRVHNSRVCLTRWQQMI